MQYITAMKFITTHKKFRENGGASGKNNIFSTISLYFHPSPFKIRAIPPYEICFWNEQDLGNPQLKRNAHVCYELKIL